MADQARTIGCIKEKEEDDITVFEAPVPMQAEAEASATWTVQGEIDKLEPLLRGATSSRLRDCPISCCDVICEALTQCLLWIGSLSCCDCCCDCCCNTCCPPSSSSSS